MPPRTRRKIPAGWKPVSITRVDEVVAEDVWDYMLNGKKMTCRIEVGRPQPDPSGQDWYCPVRLDAVSKQWKAMYGVGPVDALRNAMALVNRFFHEHANVAPRGGVSLRARARKTVS